MTKKPKARQGNFKVTVKPGDIQLTEYDKYRWITANDIPAFKANKSCKIVYTEPLLIF